MTFSKNRYPWHFLTGSMIFFRTKYLLRYPQALANQNVFDTWLMMFATFSVCLYACKKWKCKEFLNFTETLELVVRIHRKLEDFQNPVLGYYLWNSKLEVMGTQILSHSCLWNFWLCSWKFMEYQIHSHGSSCNHTVHHFRIHVHGDLQMFMRFETHSNS